jgi:GNAT superfamily N-acetyltransferase
MVYRVAGEKDLEALALMRWEFQREDRPEPLSCEAWDFVEACALFLQRGLAQRNWAYWVAEAEREIVSHLFVQFVEKVPKPGQLHGRWGYVTNVYTKPNFRNRGIGSELLRRVRSWAEEIGLELLIVWPSERSVPFYERAGFSANSEILELILSED